MSSPARLSSYQLVASADPENLTIAYVLRLHFQQVFDQTYILTVVRQRMIARGERLAIDRKASQDPAGTS